MSYETFDYPSIGTIHAMKWLYCNLNTHEITHNFILNIKCANKRCHQGLKGELMII